VKSDDLKNCIGFGIAGNFADHLEQAGEIADFLNVKTDEEKAPKGLFPFYQPKNKESFLNIFPLSDSIIQMPETGENLQAEPEVALYCQIVYEDEKVKELIPLKFAAYNDCSIRREGAKKISVKKNWGEKTKGVSEAFIDIKKFEKGSLMDTFHIASFLKRDNIMHEYGEDSPVLGYSYFYKKLASWVVQKMNTQKDSGPLEDIGEILKSNEYPRHALISIGATRYADFGEKNFLQYGDEIFIAVYDSSRYSHDEIFGFAKNGDIKKEGISFLRQLVTNHS